MQAVGQVAGRAVGSAYHKRNRKQELAQRGAQEEGSGAERRHPHFLSQRISPIGPSSVTRRGERSKEYNYVTRANYIHLRDSALNYARLLGRELGHEPDGNLGACIADLYRKLAELEPSLHLNLESDGNRLHFVFWQAHSWGGHTLYWLHTKILESLSPEMREATLLFFRKLRIATGMQTLQECYEIDYMRDIVEDNPDGYNNDEGWSVLKDYKKGGTVYELMSEIERGPDPDADLALMLSRMRPGSKEDKELLDIMREGIKFTESGNRSIFEYEYHPLMDEDYGNEIIEMDRMVRFIYDDDMVCNQMIEWLNNEYGNGADECVPATCLRLRPDTGSVFMQDTFLDEFFVYMSKLIECVNNY